MPEFILDQQYTFADAKFEFRLTGDGDDWGNTMHWWFVIADEIYWNRGFPVPDEWQFRPSPIGPQNEDDDYTTEVVKGMDDDALSRFGAVMHRYAGWLKRAGRDY